MECLCVPTKFYNPEISQRLKHLIHSKKFLQIKKKKYINTLL